MELTGQCKKDFKKWIWGQSDEWRLYDIDQRSLIARFENPYFFYQLPDSMRFGVYVDFFDSKDIAIVVDKWWCQDNDTEHFEVCINYRSKSDYLYTRQEARTKAIELANEIYNNRA